MTTDFTYGGKQILSSGPFKPGGKDMPVDVRTRVESYADIASIPNPHVGLKITVKVDETNNNKMTDYIVKSLKANSYGIANTVIDEVVRYVDYLGISIGGSISGSGAGLTDEEKQQLSTAYNHSQSPHVKTSDIPTKTSQLTNDSKFASEMYVTNAINNAQLGGGNTDIDLSIYQLIHDNTLTTSAKTIPAAINELKSEIQTQISLILDRIKRLEDNSSSTPDTPDEPDEPDTPDPPDEPDTPEIPVTPGSYVTDENGNRLMAEDGSYLITD